MEVNLVTHRVIIQVLLLICVFVRATVGTILYVLSISKNVCTHTRSNQNEKLHFPHFLHLHVCLSVTCVLIGKSVLIKNNLHKIALDVSACRK